MTTKLPRSTDVKSGLGLRKIFRRRKPTFTPQDMHKKGRISDSWKRPVGLHSKMRQRLKHHKRIVKVGYKAPALARNYHKSGVMPIVVASVADVANLSSGQGAIIARTTGAKTKLALIDACTSKGIPIINLNAAAFKSAQESLKQEKSAARAAREARKEQSKKDSASSAKKQEKAQKQSAQDAPTSEEKKAAEKKEKDEALIHTS